MANESEYKEHLKPGNRVWLKVWDPDTAPAKSVFVTYGGDGDMVYAGYQQLCTATYLLFDHTTGSGKKTQIETVMFNADTVKQIGRVAE